MGRILKYIFLEQTPAVFKEKYEKAEKIQRKHERENGYRSCSCEDCKFYNDIEEELRHSEDLDFQVVRHDLPDEHIYTRTEVHDDLIKFIEEEKYYEASALLKILSIWSEYPDECETCFLRYN